MHDVEAARKIAYQLISFLDTVSAHAPAFGCSWPLAARGWTGRWSSAWRSRPGTAWTAAQTDSTWPVRLDKVAVDPGNATVTARADFADRPVLAKPATLGIQAHRGVLFGLADQAALALLAAGVLTLVVLVYRMWWQRRPARADRPGPLGAAPERGTWQHLPLWFVVPAPLVLIAIGSAIRLLGLGLLAFLVLDALIGLARRRGRARTDAAAGSAG